MDREQVLQLYDAYSDDVYRLACSYLLDPHNAQDAVQETFLKVFRYFGDYRHRGHFRAFLYRVAANVCADIRRRRTWDPMPEQVSFEERGLREGEDRGGRDAPRKEHDHAMDEMRYFAMDLAGEEESAFAAVAVERR